MEKRVQIVIFQVEKKTYWRVYAAITKDPAHTLMEIEFRSNRLKLSEKLVLTMLIKSHNGHEVQKWPGFDIRMVKSRKNGFLRLDCCIGYATPIKCVCVCVCVCVSVCVIVCEVIVDPEA